MLWTKLMFEPFKQIWENRDYYDYNIRDENAPWYKPVWQTIRHTIGDLAPISSSSAERALDTGGTMTKDVPLAAGVVVIESGDLLHARLKAALAGADRGSSSRPWPSCRLCGSQRPIGSPSRAPGRYCGHAETPLSLAAGAAADDMDDL
jgi:hypothetical protein